MFAVTNSKKNIGQICLLAVINCEQKRKKYHNVRWDKKNKKSCLLATYKTCHKYQSAKKRSIKNNINS